MVPHEEFLRLCAAATAGELNLDERARLEAHLAECPECRQALREYEIASEHAIAALSSDGEPKESESNSQWSLEDAEKKFLKCVHAEEGSSKDDGGEQVKRGQRFGYRPSQFRWREVWMSLAAVALLSVALVVTAYRTGVKRGTDVAHNVSQPVKESESSLEAQASDAGYERVQLLAKLDENAKTIEGLKHELAEQIKVVNSLKSTETAASHATESQQPVVAAGAQSKDHRDEELGTAQAKLVELQKTVDGATAQRDENAREAATLEAKVNELTELLRQREQALDQSETEVAKKQELLEHDRDIRELMGARDLYMADVHDVSGKGTEKTYGRVFYTRGKRLIFYAFDLDAQPGLQNARSFQAWGRRGPDKQQARSLGIFYEDNASKKRWVLKADDPKSLEDIDAVFVTVEPNGGSPHPSGKQLLFAYLRIDPNHP
jgi:Anti-sigma-K factor rskA/Putative zinc-finger